jgi:uncharacterized cupin superfamily protein
MEKVNVHSVPVEHRRSPGGRFELRRQNVSLALGGIKDTGPWGGGHPFDVELVTLPPGKANFPLHAHAAQTEYYLIISGRGRLIGEGTEEVIGAGDHVICHPGEEHQIIADEGAEALVYYVLADHHRADVISYPRSGRKMLKPEYRVVQVSDADYYEGEE